MDMGMDDSRLKKIIADNLIPLNTKGVLRIVRENYLDPNITLIEDTVKRYASPEIICMTVKNYTISKEDPMLLVKSIVLQYIDGIGLWIWFEYS